MNDEERIKMMSRTHIVHAETMLKVSEHLLKDEISRIKTHLVILKPDYTSRIEPIEDFQKISAILLSGGMIKRGEYTFLKDCFDKFGRLDLVNVLIAAEQEIAKVSESRKPGTKVTADPKPSTSGLKRTGSFSQDTTDDSEIKKRRYELTRDREEDPALNDAKESFRAEEPKYQINHSDYEKKSDECLGHGSFGEVYVYRHKRTGRKIAVKEVKLLSDKTKKEEELMNEVQIMSNISLEGHPNIVQYFFHHIDDKNHKNRMLYIAMELMKGGSLRKKIGEALPETKVKDYTRQILLGVQFLHKKRIVHRDIKCENILLDADERILKLTDFGVAKQLLEATSRRGVKTAETGTCRYMAPEVISATEDQGYGKKCDIWSTGCVLLEMLTGKVVWGHLGNIQAMYQIGHGKRPLIPTGANVPDHAEKFLDQTFIINPDNRPSAENLLCDIWLADEQPRSESSDTTQ